MRWISVLLIVLLAGLQTSLWVGDGSLAEVTQLSRAVEKQKLSNKRLKERNDTLAAEVMDLKKGLQAVEERARSELGKIKKQHETFYQIVEQSRNK